MAAVAAPVAAIKENASSKDVENTAEETPVSPDTKAFIAIKQGISMVSRTVGGGEVRFLHRALRNLGRVRRALTAVALHRGLDLGYPESDARLGELRAFIGGDIVPMDVAETIDEGTKSEDTRIPEVQLYMQLLTIAYLIDNKKLAEAAKCSTGLITQANATRNAVTNELVAKCFYFYSWTHELVGNSGAIRGDLFAALRTSTLHDDDAGQAVVLNLLFRNFLNHNLVDQAQRLASKTVFPQTAPNSEAARYLYYQGRVDAIQLEYTRAYSNLELAIRKAPKGAIGFLQAATKLSIIVKMLLGDIPKRDVFGQPELERSLRPYLSLTQAVRVGDLKQFQEVVDANKTLFIEHKNYTLILRLRHNVIKTGVRRISTSYSRISLGDVAAKLQLDGPEDAEYIVAKAIRDGVIDASINHAEGYVRSNELVDVYATAEPQEAFHRRIQFCLNLYNDSVRAMQFPPNAYRKYLEKPKSRTDVSEEDLEEILDDDDF